MIFTIEISGGSVSLAAPDYTSTASWGREGEKFKTAKEAVSHLVESFIYCSAWGDDATNEDYALQ